MKKQAYVTKGLGNMSWVSQLAELEFDPLAGTGLGFEVRWIWDQILVLLQIITMIFWVVYLTTQSLRFHI